MSKKRNIYDEPEDPGALTRQELEAAYDDYIKAKATLASMPYLPVAIGSETPFWRIPLHRALSSLAAYLVQVGEEAHANEEKLAQMERDIAAVRRVLLGEGTR